jgi:hypothetical protein
MDAREAIAQIDAPALHEAADSSFESPQDAVEEGFVAALQQFMDAANFRDPDTGALLPIDKLSMAWGIRIGIEAATAALQHAPRAGR